MLERKGSVAVEGLGHTVLEASVLEVAASYPSGYTVQIVEKDMVVEHLGDSYSESTYWNCCIQAVLGAAQLVDIGQGVLQHHKATAVRNGLVLSVPELAPPVLFACSMLQLVAAAVYLEREIG